MGDVIGQIVPLRKGNSADGFGGCNRWLVTKEYQCVGAQAVR